jgi:hypothetical protein
MFLGLFGVGLMILGCFFLYRLWKMHSTRSSFDEAGVFSERGSR